MHPSSAKPATFAQRVQAAAQYLHRGQLSEAEKMLQALMRQAPADPDVLQLFGALLFRQERPAEAAVQLGRSLQAKPNQPEVQMNLAHLLEGMGRYDEVLEVLESVLKYDPQHLFAHRDYNHLLYRLRRDDRFLSSYDEAAMHAPRNLQLLLGKAWFLLNAERFAEARSLYESVLAAEPGDPIAAAGVAVALEKMGKFGPALDCYRAALARHPHDANLHSSIASVLLKLGEPGQAAEAAQAGLSTSPDDQMCLAALGFAWRMQGDAREDWLCRYDAFIRVLDLDVPRDFSRMADFNRELNAFLDRHHPDTREYVNQSLRGGTQTPQDVLGAGHRLVDLLQQRIDEALERYIAELPQEDHPFLRRRGAGFKYAGSWSSRLHDRGFHANHVHPRGWISSCYYVSLPDAVKDARTRQGWLKFGEPSYDFGLPDPIRRYVQPRVGRLVLFPSYLWHGTVPFSSTSPRTTIAFDAVPEL